MKCCKFFSQSVVVSTLTIAGVAVIFSPLNALADDAEAVLRQDFGLTKSGSGNYWIAAEERRLRESITKQQRQRSQVITGQKALDDYIQANAERFQADAPLRAALQRKLASLSSDDAERETITKQLKQLNSRATAPRDLPNHPVARDKIVQLIQHRSRLTIAAANLTRAHARLLDRYKSLANECKVKKALQTLGTRHHLGPAQDYSRNLKELDRPQRTNYVLLFKSGEHSRLTGVINERMPITFTWKKDADVITLPIRAVAGANIEMVNATATTRSIGKRRRVTMQRVRLPSLRFGKAELKDVLVDVLPPSAEDVGASIGPNSIDGYVVKLKPELLRVTFRSSGE